MSLEEDGSERETAIQTERLTFQTVDLYLLRLTIRFTVTSIFYTAKKHLVELTWQ